MGSREEQGRAGEGGARVGGLFSGIKRVNNSQVERQRRKGWWEASLRRFLAFGFIMLLPKKSMRKALCLGRHPDFSGKKQKPSQTDSYSPPL